MTKKNKKINLKLYRPDANESIMLLEAFEKAVHKTLQPINTSFGATITASTAKHFVQNVYLLSETYTPKVVQNAIQAIIESDLKNLSGMDLVDAYNGLVNNIKLLLNGLDEISDSMTIMYRSIPIHYRVGLMFRATNAKKTKLRIAELVLSLEDLLRLLHASYSPTKL